MTHNTFVGLDPGSRSGAVAVITSSGTPLLVVCLPRTLRPGGKPCLDARALYDLLLPHKEGCLLACMELVGARPTDGRKALASFMRAAGKASAVLSLLGLPAEEVDPPTWKAVILRGTKKDKDAAVAYAVTRWPAADLRRTPACKGPSEDICEALCLAEYARRRTLGA